jgi:protein-L-isoaspartate(D-aspartate) O-methyltransferase
VVTLDELRRVFAEEVEAVAHLDQPALVDAFARVPREAFLGPGPWQIAKLGDREAPYRTTVDADPRRIYHDVLVGIDPSRRLNNGQPSALARWFAGTDFRRGDAALHIGCGVGYYTAIIAELVGPSGRVHGYELDPTLAERARANLAAWSNVTVEAGDASAPTGPFDAIFVNAGCTFARREWLAALAPGGRLVLPLTVHLPHMPSLGGVGAMVRIDRPAAGPGADARLPDRWAARAFSQVGIFDCAGARDPAHEPILRALAVPGGAERIKAVAIEPHDKADACLAHLDGFCLQA